MVINVSSVQDNGGFPDSRVTRIESCDFIVLIGDP